MRPNATAAVLAVAAAAAAAAVAAAAAGIPAAHASVHGAMPGGEPALAGMQIDGLSGGGHAVLLVFAARGGDGAAAAADPPLPPPQRPSLERGWARTASGLHVLDGEGASVMVTGGGTIVVRSADRSSVVFAVPAAGATGQAGDRYSVAAYAYGGRGGPEAAVFDAVLGPGRGGADGGPVQEPASGQGQGAASAKEGEADAADAAAAGGRLSDGLAAAVTVTERVPFGGTLVVQGRIYDASLNADPRVVPRGPGAVPGVPVEVTVTDKRTGQAVLEWAGTTDASGLFRAEHRWSNTDPPGTLAVEVSVDGGRLVEERAAFYMGR